MQNKQQLGNDLQIVQTLGELVEAYEQIYLVKMQKVRRNVLETRSYMEGLANIYSELKTAYTQELLSKKVRRKTIQEKLLAVLRKNHRSVAVFLSSSKKLSGDINYKVFQRFLSFVQNNAEIDIVIVGSIGKDLYIRSGHKSPYKYFALSEEEVTAQALKPVIDLIVPYETVKVFYGKFVNFVTQLDTASDLRGNQTSLTQKDQPSAANYFIFEPSLETLLSFFDTQIFASLFKQTAQESYLAQIGSRINALEIATVNIDTRFKELNRTRRKLAKYKRNKKQRQTLSGMSLWHS